MDDLATTSKARESSVSGQAVGRVIAEGSDGDGYQARSV